MRNLAEAFASEETALRGMVVTQAHSALGEHTGARLAELPGHSPEKIARFQRDETVMQA